jgi:hypothetical protein
MVVVGNGGGEKLVVVGGKRIGVWDGSEVYLMSGMAWGR